MKKYIHKIIFLLIFILVDQLSKYIIRIRQLADGGFYICNKNLAFGLSPLKIFILLFGITAVALVFNLKFQIINFKSILNYKFQISNFSGARVSGIILIIAGAFSNIIDRFSFGCVIDFIDLKFWPVFNLADIYITIGSILLVWNIFSKKKKDRDDEI